MIHDVDVAVEAATAGGDHLPIVIGHSMGGLATLTYAATTSRPLAAIALLAPVVPSVFASEPIPLDIDMDQPWGPPPPDIARHLFYSGVDDETAERCYARLQSESPTVCWQATRWTADVEVDAIKAPSLVVAASDDPLVPADYVRALGRGIGAHEIYLEGVGHGLTLDPGWEELAGQIEGWLLNTVQ